MEWISTEKNLIYTLVVNSLILAPFKQKFEINIDVSDLMLSNDFFAPQMLFRKNYFKKNQHKNQMNIIFIMWKK